MSLDDENECPWCQKPLLDGEPFVKDLDGDKLHLHCAAEEQDGLDLEHFR